MNKTVKFVLMILASMVVGGVLGFGVIWFGMDGLTADMVEKLENSLALGVPVVQALAILVCSLTAASYMKRARRLAAALDAGDEDQAEPALRAADTAINLLEMQQMLVMFLLPLSVTKMGLSLLASSLLVVVSMPLVILGQGRIVDFIRRINPEKRGDVRDLKFNKEWYNSCDEAERQKIGRASYRTVLATQMVLVALLVVVVIVRLLVPGDNLAAWCLLAAILTLKISFWAGCSRAEKKGGEAL